MSVTLDIIPLANCGQQDKLIKQRARIRAFIEANSKLNTGKTHSLLDGYGIPNREDGEGYTRIRRVLCRAAEIKFFVKFISSSDAPLRRAFRTVCGDAPNKTVCELKDVLCDVAKKRENICVPVYRISRLMLFAFEDIPLLDADGIRTLLEKAGKETLAMALKAAGDAIPFLAALPKRDASMIKEDIEFMGAVPVARVRAAQSKIQSIACKLILQDRIKLPLAPCNAIANAECCKTGGAENKNAYDIWEDISFDAGDVLTEEARRGIIECAASLRAASRDFILQKADGKRDEVRATLGEYSEGADFGIAAAMWEKDYKRLKMRVYIRELQGVHKELMCFLCCVPRAKTQEFLAGLEASSAITEDAEKAIWYAVRQSSLLWSDVALLNYADMSGAWDECTPSQVSTALAGADDETKRIILDSIAPYYGIISLSGESTVNEWRRDVVRRGMEELVKEVSRHTTAEEIETARDEVLNALVNCEGVKQWMQGRGRGYTA